MHTITFEYTDENGEECTGELPACFEVCPRCRGEGKHVNPAIDEHGITGEEWENEWDDEGREMYMRGGYDVLCYECHGERLISVVDRERADRALLATYDAIQKADAEYEAICRAERAMGA